MECFSSNFLKKREVLKAQHQTLAGTETLLYMPLDIYIYVRYGTISWSCGIKKSTLATRIIPELLVNSRTTCDFVKSWDWCVPKTSKVILNPDMPPRLVFLSGSFRLVCNSCNRLEDVMFRLLTANAHWISRLLLSCAYFLLFQTATYHQSQPGKKKQNNNTSWVPKLDCILCIHLSLLWGGSLPYGAGQRVEGPSCPHWVNRTKQVT